LIRKDSCFAVLRGGGVELMKRSYDVIVAGGGIAGIAAALASARMGAKTCLLEKEYALGGLATLGLIVVYLPLCDGRGIQMSGGIAEELLHLSLRYNRSKLPDTWSHESTAQERAAGPRYRVNLNPPSFMILTEQLLLSAGVEIYYDVRLSGVQKSGGGIASVFIETKRGRLEIEAHSFVDATGDADLCFFSGEDTYDDPGNRRTGWFFTYNGEKLALRAMTDPIYGEIPAGSRTYSGTDIDDIAQHMIDMRRMILDEVDKLQKNEGSGILPAIIPSYHGLRMTRRLAGVFEFDAGLHDFVWFHDAIGMIGSWREAGHRYSVPYRCIRGVHNDNLYAAGRCASAVNSGWDQLRVIPACAVTGEAAGTAAAMQAREGVAPEIDALQKRLIDNGVLLKPDLFSSKL